VTKRTTEWRARWSDIALRAQQEEPRGEWHPELTRNGSAGLPCSLWPESLRKTAGKPILQTCCIVRTGT